MKIEEAIALLNELAALDRPAVAAFVANRVPCNRALAGHKSCPVYIQHGGWWVSGLCVINGLFGTDMGFGPIAFEFEDDPAANLGRLRSFVLSPHATLFDPPTLDEAIDYLNDLVELDRPAIAALMTNRVPCNRALADHPTVQAADYHGGYSVGLLGILNGLYGVNGQQWGYITAVFDVDKRGQTNLVRFTKLEENES